MISTSRCRKWFHPVPEALQVVRRNAAAALPILHIEKPGKLERIFLETKSHFCNTMFHLTLTSKKYMERIRILFNAFKARGDIEMGRVIC